MKKFLFNSLFLQISKFQTSRPTDDSDSRLDVEVKQEEKARRTPLPQAFPASMMDSKICSTGPALRQADKIGQKMVL